jgi:hypothetical protein
MSLFLPLGYHLERIYNVPSGSLIFFPVEF